jgi:catechol 2,3-dioxygenase-like lactoylglutathione lyase family enzyme
MTTPTAPIVDCDRQHPALAVRDVAAAVDFYTKRLGFTVGFTWGDPPAIAGVNLGRVQMFLERGTPNPGGCSVYFVVGDADELYEFQRANGVDVMEPPENRPYGLRDYRIRDLHGYELCFGHHVFDSGPPL